MITACSLKYLQSYLTETWASFDYFTEICDPMHISKRNRSGIFPLERSGKSALVCSGVSAIKKLFFIPLPRSLLQLPSALIPMCSTHDVIRNYLINEISPWQKDCRPIGNEKVPYLDAGSFAFSAIGAGLSPPCLSLSNHAWLSNGRN